MVSLFGGRSFWLLAVKTLSILKHAPSTTQAELRWYESFRLPVLYKLGKNHQLWVPKGLLYLSNFLFSCDRAYERLIFRKDFQFSHVVSDEFVDVCLFLKEKFPND